MGFSPPSAISGSTPNMTQLSWREEDARMRAPV